jgi:ketosteroid isomerase-like protein
MPQEPEEVTRAAYEGFNREKRLARELYHHDAVYVNSREDPDHGAWEGIDAIEELAQSWVEAYPDLVVEPLEVLANGDTVFAWTRFSGHGAGSGMSIDMQLAHVVTIEDGKIRRLEEYMDRAEGLHVAGLAERPVES